MAKKLEIVSRQLQEISKIVNSFKSEAVQLRVVDLLINDLPLDEGKKVKAAAKKQVAKPAPKKKAVIKKKKVASKAKVAPVKSVTIKAAPAKAIVAKPAKAAKKVSKKKVVKKAAPKTAKKAVSKKSSKKKSTLPGPSKTVTQLFTEGFFTSKKNIADVLKHSNDVLKLPYRVTDLSGILNKLVKDKKLKRDKNAATRKFEYINA